ncbi:MAG TPA: hypothetical protein VK644_01580 [Chitinophagaceae bacterium]|nr:hypothetical protein [Chitinophagaceae bacterium]
MAKSKVKDLTPEQEFETELQKDERKVIITSATIKDLHCNYDYVPMVGPQRLTPLGAKGPGIIDDDLSEAMARLKAHLAYIDGAFAGKRVSDIDKFHEHEITENYHVDSIKMKGSDGDRRISIIGSKHLEAGGRMKCETPPYLIEDHSGYKFYNELKSEVDFIFHEVELYMEGKYTMPVTDDDEPEDPKQTKIQFEQPLDDSHTNDSENSPF